jgi:hypothetical protein
MEKIYIFYRFLQLIVGVIRAVLPQLVVGGIIIILIIKFIDTTWLKWLLLIMSGGALFYSIYDDIALHVQEEAMKAVKKLDKQKAEIAKGTYKIKVPTLKEGIWNWAKAIFWLGLFLLVLKFVILG